MNQHYILKSRLLDLIGSKLYEILEITEETGFITVGLAEIVFWLKTMNLIDYDETFLKRLLARMQVHLEIFKFVLSDAATLKPLSEDDFQSPVLLSNQISFSNKVLKNETEIPDFLPNGQKGELVYWLFVQDLDSIKKEYNVDEEEVEDEDSKVGHWAKFLLINQLHLILTLDSKLSRSGIFNAINHLVDHINSKANLHDLWIEEYKQLFTS